MTPNISFELLKIWIHGPQSNNRVLIHIRLSYNLKMDDIEKFGFAVIYARVIMNYKMKK
jgi:hypothetical protein